MFFITSDEIKKAENTDPTDQHHHHEQELAAVVDERCGAHGKADGTEGGYRFEKIDAETVGDDCARIGRCGLGDEQKQKNECDKKNRHADNGQAFHDIGITDAFFEDMRIKNAMKFGHGRNA